MKNGRFVQSVVPGTGAKYLSNFYVYHCYRVNLWHWQIVKTERVMLVLYCFRLYEWSLILKPCKSAPRVLWREELEFRPCIVVVLQENTIKRYCIFCCRAHGSAWYNSSVLFDFHFQLKKKAVANTLHLWILTCFSPFPSVVSPFISSCSSISPPSSLLVTALCLTSALPLPASLPQTGQRQINNECG